MFLHDFQSFVKHYSNIIKNNITIYKTEVKKFRNLSETLIEKGKTYDLSHLEELYSKSRQSWSLKENITP